jgi:hypothetical protein
VDGAEVERAIHAARSITLELGLPADDATVLHNSNKLALRLLPCDVVARVAHVGREVAALEVELAQRLREGGAPAGALDPRVEPGVYECDGYAITLWSYCEPATAELAPADYADALQRLHAAMREIHVATPHFTDRVASAELAVTTPDLTPELVDDDRVLLAGMLRGLQQAICDRGAPEQLLHGEPHPGNVLNTASGPVFIDLEACCRGPVEFDVAHVPEAVSDRYPGVDQDLLRDCRHLVLAMVTAWRWESDDQFPGGKRAGRELLRVLRAGPPWPTLDALFGRPDAR